MKHKKKKWCPALLYDMGPPAVQTQHSKAECKWYVELHDWPG